jgi:hypothetical protein
MTQDANLKMVHKTGSSKNKEQHTIGCEYIQIKVNDRQLIIYYTADLDKELRHHFSSARNRKPPWSTKESVRTVHEIEHHDVMSSAIYSDEFHGNCPQQWTKQASINIEKATENSLEKVIADAHN